jgi:hypothetical protein
VPRDRQKRKNGKGRRKSQHLVSSSVRAEFGRPRTFRRFDQLSGLAGSLKEDEEVSALRFPRKRGEKGRTHSALSQSTHITSGGASSAALSAGSTIPERLDDALLSSISSAPAASCGASLRVMVEVREGVEDGVGRVGAARVVIGSLEGEKRGRGARAALCRLRADDFC